MPVWKITNLFKVLPLLPLNTAVYRCLPLFTAVGIAGRCAYDSGVIGHSKGFEAPKTPLGLQRKTGAARWLLLFSLFRRRAANSLLY